MKSVLLALGLAFCLASPAVAHHNWAAIYDVDGDIEFEGVISSIEFVNPHIRISFTVDAGTPNEMTYTTESNSVASLTRMGVTKELLAVGTPVRVAGYPSRTRDDDMFMNHLLLPSGREIVFLRTAEARWPEATRVGSADVLHGVVVEEDYSKRPTSIFGVWSTIYGAEGSHQAMRAEVQWTDYALSYQEQVRSDGSSQEAALESSCTRSILGALGSPYPIQLIDNQDGTLTLHAEYYDSIRTIHLGDMPADPVIPHEFNGHYSVGRFVGETLVVDSLFYREGGKDGDNYEHLIETFTLTEDHNRLQYSRVTIDPLFRSLPTFQRKWWQYVPGSFVQPYDCAY